MNSHNINLYQNVYSEQIFLEVEEGYKILDNRKNLRPDWYEYWPMRHFLLNETLNENEFYGFFSPKFKNKTLLSHAEVIDFIKSHDSNKTDIFLFSPQPDMSAFFLSIFEQQELFSPGFIKCGQDFCKVAGIEIDLAGLVTDSSNTVFSNYFVAKPKFWREWLRLGELLFSVAETPGTELYEQLNQQTAYTGNVQFKVFLMERLATLLLVLKPNDFHVIAHNPWSMGWSMSQLRNFPHEAVLSDALKLAYKSHGFKEYLSAFAKVRALSINKAV